MNKSIRYFLAWKNKPHIPLKMQVKVVSFMRDLKYSSLFIFSDDILLLLG